MESKQRKDDRFLAPNNVYVSLGSGLTKVGSMKDISKGGIAFEYILFEDSDMEDIKQVHIEIFVSQNGFHLTNLPCCIKYDVPVFSLNTNHIYSTPFITKRCGMQFSTLTEHQTGEITAFLEQHTTGLVSSQ